MSEIVAEGTVWESIVSVVAPGDTEWEAEDYIDSADRAVGRSSAPSPDDDPSDLVHLIGLVYDDEPFEEAVRVLWHIGYRLLGYGTTRVVMHRPGSDVVAKIPRCEVGLGQCILEEGISRREGKKGYIPVADCWFDDNLLLLWMERVTPVDITDMEAIPEWVWSVDCQQVGRDVWGNLVAYDL